MCETTYKKYDLSKSWIKLQLKVEKEGKRTSIEYYYYYYYIHNKIFVGIKREIFSCLNHL